MKSIRFPKNKHFAIVQDVLCNQNVYRTVLGVRSKFPLLNPKCICWAVTFVMLVVHVHTCANVDQTFVCMIVYQCPSDVFLHDTT